jgi:hypothetical protein
VAFIPDHFKKRIMENVPVFKQRADDFSAAESF